MAQATSLTHPVPQIEPGKAKSVSINELPADLRKVVESDMRGGGTMSEDEAQARKNYQGRVKGMDELNGRLKSGLADISATDLSNYRFEGVIPQGPTSDGPWSSFVRVFKRPDGVVVTLFEWDYVADGGGVLTVNELMNTSVNGYPAQFAVRRSPLGDTISELRWVTNRKSFSLAVSDNVEQPHAPSYDKKWLMGMAEKIR